MPYRGGSWNSFVIALWKVQPVQALAVISAHIRMCAAFAAAEDTVKGPVPAGRYLHYYYYDTDEIVCSTGSYSEGEPNLLDPPANRNEEEDWVARYHEHVRRRAAGEVGPIKTIPKPRTSPSGPAGQLPALDTKLLVTSKVMSESESVRVRTCSPS